MIPNNESFQVFQAPTILPCFFKLHQSGPFVHPWAFNTSAGCVKETAKISPKPPAAKRCHWRSVMGHQGWKLKAHPVLSQSFSSRRWRGPPVCSCDQNFAKSWFKSFRNWCNFQPMSYVFQEHHSWTYNHFLKNNAFPPSIPIHFRLQSEPKQLRCY